MNQKIAGVEVGPDQPCRVVAEISNNHNGDFGLALKLVSQVHEAGADFVKFQAYTPRELVALRGAGPAPDLWGEQGMTMEELYEQAQTPMSWMPRLTDHCEAVGIPWFSSVFGLGSLSVMDALGCPVFKLAALDHGKAWLYKMVESVGKPIIRSCANPHPPRKDFNLYCPAGYPQAPTSLEPLKRYDGFSYHGTDPAVPLRAAALGAQMLEVHVQLDDEQSNLESNISLTVKQLADMVRDLRAQEEWR